MLVSLIGIDESFDKITMCDQIVASSTTARF